MTTESYESAAAFVGFLTEAELEEINLEASCAYISDEECAAYAEAEDMEALALAPAHDLTDEDIDALALRISIEDVIIEMARERIMADAFAAIDHIEKTVRRAADDVRRHNRELSIQRAKKGLDWA